MSAERAQIENDISYISHNLKQLISERQQFHLKKKLINFNYYMLI